MKSVLKSIVWLLLFGAAASLAVSCRSGAASGASDVYELSGGYVRQGQPLRAVLLGGRSGAEIKIKASAGVYDSGKSSADDALVMMSGGQNLSQWSSVELDERGRLELVSGGFPAEGMYIVSVDVDDGDNVTVSLSSLVEVIARSGDGTPGDDGTDDPGEGGGEDNPGSGEGDEGPDKVSSVTVPSPGLDGRIGLEMGSGSLLPVTIVYDTQDGGPRAGHEAEIRISSSDEDVVLAEWGDGGVVVTPVYPGYAVIYVTAGDITKTIPVRVHADVTVTIDFYESDATQAQLNTKTFPCQLRFAMTPAMKLPTDLRWAVTAKAIVNVEGRDTQNVTDSRTVSLKGPGNAYYNITQNILLPAYLKADKLDHTVSLTLSLQYDNPLDKNLWTVTVNEKYRTQDARIKQYVTTILQ